MKNSPQGKLERGEKVEYLEGEPTNAEEDDHHEKHFCHLQRVDLDLVVFYEHTSNSNFFYFSTRKCSFVELHEYL